MAKAEVATETDLARINAIVSEYSQQRWALIPLLQKIQNEIGYIPPQSIPVIAEALGLFPSQVQGVISFYAQLYTEPRGRRVVRVCRGTACHVRGGKTILRLVKRKTLRWKSVAATVMAFVNKVRTWLLNPKAFSTPMSRLKMPRRLSAPTSATVSR